MNTGKIIKITEDTIFIGYEDGSIKEIRRSSVDFEPSLGDLVEIYGEIIIKSTGKKYRKPFNQFNFSKLSLTNKINLITIVILVTVSFLLALIPTHYHYVANLSTLLLVSSILVFILNLVLLFIQVVKKKQRSEKKISFIYLLASIAIFFVTFIMIGSLYNNTNTTSESTHIVDTISGPPYTIDKFLKARGLSVKGYGKVYSKPKEQGNNITFELGELDEFIFNNGEDSQKSFDNDETDSVTATVSIPKSLYLNDISEGDIISVNGETSQDKEMGIVVSNYFLSNYRNSSSSSSEVSTSSSSSTPTEEIDMDKSHYGDVDYNQWNHDEVEKKTKIRISGKVLQEQDSEGLHTLRIAMDNDYDKIVYVAILDKYYERTIAEDDQITLYGLALGRESYTTVLGASKTLPFMVAYMYEN